MATSGAWQPENVQPSKFRIPLENVPGNQQRADSNSLIDASPSSTTLQTVNTAPLHAGRAGALGPLHEPMFRSLWIAAVISYTGTWMQNLGAGWLMTSLTMSPLMVGLVQAAGSIAVFLVVLPAGAIADVVDRRKLLLFTQGWMVIAAAALGVLTIAGKVTPGLLLLCTLLMGFGAVLNDPAWQAITPEVVSRENFASGVALNSAGFNAARAIGPALGGLVIAAAGSGIAFLLNAASFFGVIYFLYRWKPVPRRTSLRARNAVAAMFHGFHYLRTSTSMKAVLVRTGTFSLCASALPALLPLLAHPWGSEGYGVLLGFFGCGSLAGAALIPLFRRSLSPGLLVSLATGVFAFSTFAGGKLQGCPGLSVVMFVSGMAWIQILATLNVAAQILSPHDMRARAISMYLLVLQGGFAAGSALWGAVAERVGIERALTDAAIGLVFGLVATAWFGLPHADSRPAVLAID